MASKKRSHDDMRNSRSPSKGIDQVAYRTYVLQLPAGATEDELDHNLNDQAHELGIVFPHAPAAIDGLASSFSASTISSDPTNQVSRLSQSTAPTSCSSSFHRPATQPSISQGCDKLPTASKKPSILYENEKKRGFGFRDGIRRMTGFRKRRSLVVTPELGSINRSTPNVQNADRMSIRSGLKSPASIKSTKSSWSVPQVAPRVHHEEPHREEQDASTRTKDCQEFKNMRMRQVGESYRFLDFQRGATTQARLENQAAKQRMLEAQEQAIQDARIRNEKAVEDLESRQLEAEAKLVDEFELAKRTILVRLRHMEAYVQNPTPPPTPQASRSSGDSDEPNLPERRVTDKDYHNLSNCYRERDAMETLHTSKIEVLRGKQSKALEAFMSKKDREVAVMELEHAKAIKDLDEVAFHDEEALNDAFMEKRSKLESRWRLQGSIENAKMESSTGLRYAPLADLVVGKEQRPWSLSSRPPATAPSSPPQAALLA